MATTKLVDTQYPLAFNADVKVKHLGAANGFTAKVPPGATVLRVAVLTVVGFNPGGTDTATLTVTDGTTVFANAVDIETAGNETVANAPKHYPTGGTISITAVETGVAPATLGHAVVVIEYVISGRGNEIAG